MTGDRLIGNDPKETAMMPNEQTKQENIRTGAAASEWQQTRRVLRFCRSLSQAVPTSCDSAIDITRRGSRSSMRRS